MFVLPSRKFGLAALLVLLLSACGGGSGQGSGPVSDGGATAPPPAVDPPPEPDPPPDEAVIGSALLSWQPPVEREDGTPLTELAGYRIEYGMDPDVLDSDTTLDNPGLTSYRVEDLTEGAWYFVVRAFDAEGRISSPSDMASKTIG